MGQRVQRRGPLVHLTLRRVTADQVGGLLCGLGTQTPLVAVADGPIRDRRRIQHGLHIHRRGYTPLLVVRSGTHATDAHQGLRAAHRHGRIVATLQRRPEHVVTGQRIVLRDAFRVEDMGGSLAARPVHGARGTVGHAKLAQGTGRLDDVAARRGGKDETRGLDHGGNDHAHGLARTGRPQHVQMPFASQPYFHVMAPPHEHGGMPWLRHDRARPALLEFGQCARQDRRRHVAHHAARTIGVRDLTPRGHARTRTKPVGRTLARIPVRIPEDPQ